VLHIGIGNEKADQTAKSALILLARSLPTHYGILMLYFLRSCDVTMKPRDAAAVLLIFSGPQVESFLGIP